MTRITSAQGVLPEGWAPSVDGAGWARPLPRTGAGGLASLAIAWLLVPLSVVLHLGGNAAALFAGTFACMLALAVFAASRRNRDAGVNLPLPITLAPWAVVAIAALGYGVASAGLDAAVYIGAALATVLAGVAAPFIYRSAGAPSGTE